MNLIIVHAFTGNIEGVYCLRPTFVCLLKMSLYCTFLYLHQVMLYYISKHYIGFATVFPFVKQGIRATCVVL